MDAARMERIRSAGGVEIARPNVSANLSCRRVSVDIVIAPLPGTGRPAPDPELRSFN